MMKSRLNLERVDKLEKVWMKLLEGTLEWQSLSSDEPFILCDCRLWWIINLNFWREPEAFKHLGCLQWSETLLKSQKKKEQFRCKVTLLQLSLNLSSALTAQWGVVDLRQVSPFKFNFLSMILTLISIQSIHCLPLCMSSAAFSMPTAIVHWNCKLPCKTLVINQSILREHLLCMTAKQLLLHQRLTCLAKHRRLWRLCLFWIIDSTFLGLLTWDFTIQNVNLIPVIRSTHSFPLLPSPVHPFLSRWPPRPRMVFHTSSIFGKED